MTRNVAVLVVIAIGAMLAVGALAQEAPCPEKGPGAGGARGPGMFPGRGGDLFEKNDKDQDGKLTLAELTEPAKRLIADADADGDGAVTKEELKAAREKRRAERPEGEGMRPRGQGRRGGGGGFGGGPGQERPGPEEAFKRIDQDGDGMISLEEFKAAHEKRQGHGRRGRGGAGGRGGGGGGGGGGR